jgi:RNA polymerase sigma factor (sigma-70 family)
MQMTPGSVPSVQMVIAAQAGDETALDSLVSGYLPLIYNIVGRALRGHADTDDVVQETMLRVVRGLAGLRDPAAFRSWLVAVAIRQVRDYRGRPAVPVDGLRPDLADPAADFVDLTILPGNCSRCGGWRPAARSSAARSRRHSGCRPATSRCGSPA